MAVAALTAPLARKTVSELVVSRILDLLRGGQLRPGDRLPPERDLAASLGVSRPSLREGLRALQILGVLEIRHGGGIHVTALDPGGLLGPLDLFVPLDPGTMAELFEARIELEPLIARRAAERMGEAGRARLADLVAQQRAEPEDATLFHDTDVEFHKTILEAAGNPFLTRLGKLLQVLGDQGRKAFQKRKGVRLRSIEDHRAILAAFEAGDPAGAEDAMRAHMTHVRQALREVTGA